MSNLNEFLDEVRKSNMWAQSLALPTIITLLRAAVDVVEAEKEGNRLAHNRPREIFSDARAHDAYVVACQLADDAIRRAHEAFDAKIKELIGGKDV